MRSVESIVGTYLRNQNQYINRLPHCVSGNLQIVWAVTEGLGIEEMFLHCSPL